MIGSGVLLNRRAFLRGTLHLLAGSVAAKAGLLQRSRPPAPMVVSPQMVKAIAYPSDELFFQTYLRPAVKAIMDRHDAELERVFALSTGLDWHCVCR